MILAVGTSDLGRGHDFWRIFADVGADESMNNAEGRVVTCRVISPQA